MANRSLKLPPGMVRPATVYDARGRWYDGNLVRWHAGIMRAIGGWSPLRTSVPSDAAVDLGAPARGMIDWRDNVQQPVLAMGTFEKLYAYRGGALYDLTPGDLTVGRVDATRAEGQYGQGVYGGGAYGTGAATGDKIDEATSWQFDTFGQSLLAVHSEDRRLLVWADPASTDPAQVVAGAPIANRGVVVTPEKFVVLLGADGDDRRIAWSDQADYSVWGIEGQAGDFNLTASGSLMAGRKGSNETLLWTDTDLWRMRFIGGEFIYSITQVAGSCGAISRHSMTVVDGKAYWMGKGNFFRYDGFVQPIPCEVAEYVFGSFNKTQASKVTSYARSQFGEVTWHYPSAGSEECDRYVTYNYLGDFWIIGELERTSGTDSTVFGFPLAADAAGAVYQHEIDHGEYLNPAGEPLSPYLVSGPYEIGQGDHVMDIHQLIPDVNTLGAVTVRLLTSIQPVTEEVEHGPFELTAPTPLRLTARQVRLVIEGQESNWRVGTMKLDVTPGSKR